MPEDIRLELGDAFFKNFERAVANGQWYSEQWNTLFEYLWRQVLALGHPLREDETKAWRDVVFRWIDNDVHSEIANRKTRIRCMGQFMSPEPLIMAPVVGEVIDCSTTKVMPWMLAMLFYKFDQVRASPACRGACHAVGDG